MENRLIRSLKTLRIPEGKNSIKVCTLEGAEGKISTISLNYDAPRGDAELLENVTFRIYKLIPTSRGYAKARLEVKVREINIEIVPTVEMKVDIKIAGVNFYKNNKYEIRLVRSHRKDGTDRRVHIDHSQAVAKFANTTPFNAGGLRNAVYQYKKINALMGNPDPVLIRNVDLKQVSIIPHPGGGYYDVEKDTRIGVDLAK